jgi:acyl-CoA reductase-like NAD-dependent aldehyde dehydrogenase
MTSHKTATTHHAHKPTMNAMNPATGEVIGKVPLTDMAEMPEIFAQAREAQEIWADFSFDRRRITFSVSVTTS